jgi:integrase
MQWHEIKQIVEKIFQEQKGGWQQIIILLLTGSRPFELVRNNIWIEKNKLHILVAKKRKSQILKKININKYWSEIDTQSFVGVRQINRLTKKYTGLSPRQYRHFFATSLYEKNFPIEEIKECLYHSNSKITKVYIDSWREPIQNVIKNILE